MNDDMTVRERREQRFKDQQKKDKPKQMARQVGIAAIVLVALTAVVGAMVAINANRDDCPGHWHSSFAVFVDGDKLSYQHPQFDLGQRTPMSYHLHQPNDYMVHWEPPTGGCTPMGDFLRAVDTDIKSGQLELGSSHAQLGQGGTYRDEGNSTLRAWNAPTGDDWEEISISKMLKRQPIDGERLLIAYGNYTDAEVDAMKANVPYPNSSGQAPPGHPGG